MQRFTENMNLMSRTYQFTFCLGRLKVVQLMVLGGACEQLLLLALTSPSSLTKASV